MAKIVKTLTVSWQWSGDKYSLRGFNLAITPATKNPKEEVVATAFVETKEIKQTYSYKMGNVTLDKDAQYKIWVQAVYENSDSDWVATGGATVSDDGSATIITKTDREIQDVVNMASDNILTRQEKISLRREWQEIVYEFLEIESTAISQGIPSSNTAFSNFKSKGNALGTYLNGGTEWTISSNNKTSFPLWINDSNLGSNTSINGNTYRETFRVYYEAKVKILEEINKYKVNNIQVGGTNLAIGTNQGSSRWGWALQEGDRTISSEVIDGINCVKLQKGTTTPHSGWNYVSYSKFARDKITPNTTYTASFEIKSNKTFDVGSIDLKYGNSSDTLIASSKAMAKSVKANSDWTKIIFELKTKDVLPTTTGQVIYITGISATNGNIHYIRNLQLEKGNKATDWSPAVEDLENAYTIVLTNEAQVIPTNNSRVPTSSTTYYTDIVVYQGTTQRTDYAIGTVNSANGITVSKTSSRVNFAVSTNTALTADGGNFVIPITIDGKTFNKTFSWSCSKQGNTGATGASGVGISKITEYYAVSSSNTTEPTSWSTTVPAMTATNKYLWNYETITYSNNTTANTSKRVIGVYGDKGNTGATGAAGNGISNIVNYYLATSSSSGVTTSTSGWTTSVQAVSASKKYLWNYEVITYTNGSTSTTTPCIIGAYGDTGATGPAGQNAQHVVVTGEQVFKYANNFSGTPTPATITLTATKINTTATGKWQWLNGSTWTDWSTDASTLNATTLSVSPASGSLNNGKSIRIRYIVGSVYDEITLVKVSDGTNGTNGTNGADAYTVILTNETHTFPTQNNGNIPTALSTTTQVVAYKGASSVTPTIGNLPSVSGLTLSKSGTTVTVQANTGTSLADSGSFNIPVTVDGKSFTKTFSWSKAKQGNTGATGNAGQDAITIVLSNENHTFPCESNGNIPTALSTTCVVTAYKGGTSVTPTIGAITNPTGMTITKNGATLTIQANTGTSLADSGTVNIPITVDGKTFNKTFTWSKAKKGATGATGATGAGAKTVDIIASSQVFKSTDGGKTFLPNSIVLTPVLQNVTYNGWQCSTDGGKTWSGLSNSTTGWSVSNGVLTINNNFGLFTSTNTTVAFRVNTNDSNIYDTITLVKLYDVTDIDIGGRNYIRNGKGDKKAGFFKNFNNVTGGYGEVTLTSQKRHSTINIADGFVLGCRDYEVGRKVVFSYDIMYTKWDFPSGADRKEFWIGQRYTNTSDGSEANGKWRSVTSHNLPVVGANGCKLNEWYHVSKVITIPEQADATIGTDAVIKLYNSNPDVSASFTARFKNVKLEYGNMETDWTPAPEDVATDIDNAKNEAIDSANGTLTTTISNYYTKDETNSQINVAKDAINLGVSNTYETKANVETKITSTLNNAKSYADTKKNEAINTASSDATNKVNSAKNELNTAIGKKANSSDVYSKAEVYTKGQTDSAIKVAKDEINLGVSNTYETKANVETKVSSTLNSAKSYADTKKSEAITQAGKDADSKVNSAKNELNTAIGKKANSTDVYTKSQVYTKEETNSQINIAKDNINLGISNTYETKANVETKVSSTLNSAKSYADTKKTEAINSAASDATSKVNSAKNELNTKIDNIQVGGRNLIRKADLGQNNSTATYDGATNTWTINATAGAGGTWGCGLVVKNKNALVPYGKSYVLSFEIKVPKACSWNCDVNTFALTGSSWAGNDNDNTSKRTASSKSLVANQWIKCWIKWENTNSNNTNKVDIYDNSNFGVVMKDETSNMTYQIRNVKGELGNMPTEWTPAPEDVDSAINKKANSADVYTKTQVYTKEETNSQIKVAKDEINLGVSNTYETKANVETKVSSTLNSAKSYADTKKSEAINSASSDATTKANNALNSAKSYADTKKSEAISSAATDAANKVNAAKNELNTAIGKKANSADVYTKSEVYTKTQTDSAIKVAKDEINLGVSNTYETKTNVETKINGISVGGTNLAYDTNKGATGWGWGIQTNSGKTITDHLADGIKGVKMVKDGTSGSGWNYVNYGRFKRDKITPATTYVVSFEMKSNLTFNVGSVDLKHGDSSNTLLKSITAVQNKVTANSNAWTKIVFKLTTLDTLPSSTAQVIYITGIPYSANATHYFRNLKLEVGNTATTWSPAPEDVANDIANAKNEAINTASNDATNKVNSAKSALNTEINKKANSADVYKKTEVYTKNETNSQITAAKDAITQAVSNTYETKTNVQNKINSIDIGGKNLAKQTKLLTDVALNGWTVTNTGNKGFKKLEIVTENTSWQECNIPLYTEINTITKSVTISFEYQETSSGLLMFNFGSYNGNTRVSECSNVTVSSSFKVISTNGKWKTVSYTFDPTSVNNKDGITQYKIQFKKASGKTGTIYVRKPKLELGNKATDWSPAPEDVETTVSAVEKRVTSAESKITDTAITNTVKKNFYTKQETDNQITSKGYQTSSQVQQTVDALQLKFTQSGGYNRIRNGIFKNGTSQWSKWGNPTISTKDDTGHSYGKSLVLTTTGTNQGVQQTVSNLCSGKKYTLSAYVYSWAANDCGIQIECGGSYYASKVPTAGAWQRISLTFKATSTSATVQIGRGGWGANGQHLFTAIQFEEGELATTYTPHPNEVYDGITNIDKDGIKVSTSRGAYTHFSADGMNSYDNEGNMTLGLRNGGMTFHAYNNHEYVGYISQTAQASNGYNGVSLGLTPNGDYLSFGYAENATDPNKGFSQKSYMSIAPHSNNGNNKEGINLYKNLYMHGWTIDQAQQVISDVFYANTRVKLKGSAAIYFDADATYPSMIWEDSSDGMIRMYGDNGIIMGYSNGNTSEQCFYIKETKDGLGCRIGMYDHLNMNGWRIKNATVNNCSFRLDEYKRTKDDYVSIFKASTSSKSEMNIELANDYVTWFNIQANNYVDGGRYIACFNYQNGTAANNVGVHFYRAMNCHGYNITNVGNMSVRAMSSEELEVNDIRIASPVSVARMDGKQTPNLSVVKSVDDVTEAHGVVTISNKKEKVELPYGLMFTDYYVQVTGNKVANLAVTEKTDEYFIIETDSEEEIEVFYTIKAFQPSYITRAAIYGELQGEEGIATITYEEAVKAEGLSVQEQIPEAIQPHTASAAETEGESFIIE